MTKLFLKGSVMHVELNAVVLSDYFKDLSFKTQWKYLPNVEK